MRSLRLTIASTCLVFLLLGHLVPAPLPPPSTTPSAPDPSRKLPTPPGKDTAAPSSPNTPPVPSAAEDAKPGPNEEADAPEEPAAKAEVDSVPDTEAAQLVQLEEIANFITGLKMKGTVGVAIRLDDEIINKKPEERPKSNLPDVNPTEHDKSWKYIVHVLYNPDAEPEKLAKSKNVAQAIPHKADDKADKPQGDAPKARELKEIGELMTQYWKELKEKLDGGLKGKKYNFMQHVEVEATALPAITANVEMLTGRKHHRKLSVRGRAKAKRAPKAPAKFMCGRNWLKKCNVEPTGGSCALILKDDQGAHYILSNSHVSASTGNPQCPANFKNAVYEADGEWFTTGAATNDHLEISDSSANTYDFKAANAIYDVALTKIHPGTRIGCHRGHAGVQNKAVKNNARRPKAGKTWVQFVTSMIGKEVEKRGQRTGFTKGRVTGVRAQTGDQFWGLEIQGTFPDFPANAATMNLNNAKGATIHALAYPDIGNATDPRFTAVVADRAGAALQGWESRIFAAGGDSGSGIFDSEGYPVGLQFAVSSNLGANPVVSTCLAYPMYDVLDQLTAAKAPRRFSICTERSKNA